MNNLNNIFVLRSPLQIINSLELINYFSLKNNYLIIIYNSLDTNTKQIKKLISMHEWSEIIELEDNGSSKYFRYVKLVKSLKNIQFNNFVFGNFGSVQKLMIANLKKKKTFYIDDGTSTISIYNKYIEKEKYNKYNFREIRFLLSGLKIKIIDKIYLFTYFNLKPKFENQIIQNELKYFKNKYLKYHKKCKAIYFAGQPLDDVDVLSVKEYRKVIIALSEKFNQPIVYLSHRAESEELKEEISLIDSTFIKIIESEMPLELYFLENEIYPSTFLSFFSTSLSTIKIIYEDVSVFAIEIPEEKVSNKSYYNNLLKDYYHNIKSDDKITFKELGI